MLLDVGPALIALLVMILYAVLGGADFGGGVWDLVASGPRRIEQREAVGIAMSPVWETNHVWLIFLLVLLFTCFPPVFAKLGELLFTPLVLALLGIVLRGAAFAFRGPASRDLVQHRIWGVIFGAASIITPFLFGACAAAIATGTFDWLRPMPLAVGVFAVTLCAQLAAVFLTTETSGELRDDFRVRAQYATFGVAVAGAVALAIGTMNEPHLMRHLLVPPALEIVTVAMLLGLLVLYFIGSGRAYWARIAVCVEVAAVLCGWYAAQAPYIIEQLGVQNPTAPPATIEAFLWTALVGAIVLVPSLTLLFVVFKRTSEH